MACIAWCMLAACCADPGAQEPAGSTVAGMNGDDAPFVIPAVDNSNSVSVSRPGPVVASFVASDAQSYLLPEQNGIAGRNALIVINSTPNACADANSNTYHVGEVQLVLVLTAIPDGGIFPAAYVAPAPASAPFQLSSALYVSATAPCNVTSASLVAGQVQLTEVGFNSLTGTYSLQFDSGTISGSFSAGAGCAALSRPPTTAPKCL